MKLRIAALVLALGLITATSVIPSATTHAASQPQATMTSATSAVNVPLLNGSGTQVGTINQITVTGFQVVNGVLQAVGTVSGTLLGTPFTNVPFAVPVAGTGTCQILDLVIGPIDLNLLGLMVHTDTIHLNITAQSGPGQLLGNLLCDVANLLNGNNLTGLTTLLNQLLAGLTGVPV